MPSASSEVLRHFRRFDTNGDGVIDRSELLTVLQSILPEHATDQAVDEFLAAVDRNHDGKISMKEFLDHVFPEEGRLTTFAYTPTTVCCLNGHALEALGTTRDNGWSCDGRKTAEGCRKNITRKAASAGVNRFRCHSCDYDLCEGCFVAKLVQATCRNGHPMTPLGLSRDNGRWYCDARSEGGCKSGFTSPGQCRGMNRFTCDICKYDLCEKCYLARAGHATCRGGKHALVPLGTTVDNGWFCDGRNFEGGCKSGIAAAGESKGINRYRCQPCDYDLCELCFMYCCERSARRYKQFQDALLQLPDDEANCPSGDEMCQRLQELFSNATTALADADLAHVEEVFAQIQNQLKPSVLERLPEVCVAVINQICTFLPLLEELAHEGETNDGNRRSLELVEKIGGMMRVIDRTTLGQENFQFVLRVAGAVRQGAVWGLAFELLDESRQGTVLSETGGRQDLMDDRVLARSGVRWENLLPGERVMVVSGTSTTAQGALAGSLRLQMDSGRTIEFVPEDPSPGDEFMFEATEAEQIVRVNFGNGRANRIQTAPYNGWSDPQIEEIRQGYNAACKRFCQALVAASRHLGPKEAKYALFQARQLGFSEGNDEIQEMSERVADTMRLPEDWDMSIMQAVDLGAGKGHQNLFGEKEAPAEVLEMMQELFDASLRKVYTRDRRGGNVPDRMLVERAVRIQNAENWMQFVNEQDNVRCKLHELKTTGSPGLCTKGHALEPLGLSRDNGWSCDGRKDPGGCHSGITGLRQTQGMLRFRCFPCDYDLCEKCYLARTGQKLCLHGHRLAPLGTSRDNGWFCDGRKNPEGCRRGIRRKGESQGVNRYRCDVCDFDLCDKCYQVHMGNVADSVDGVKTEGFLEPLGLVLDKETNGSWLFHGTNEEAAACIVRGDFRVDKAGSNAGTLYGRGVYLAESCSKSDEYTKENDQGQRCLLLCRATLGNVLYCDDQAPNVDRLVHMCVSGSYHSVLGDREKTRGTYREFIVYDEDLVYPEFIIWYRRVYESKT